MIKEARVLDGDSSYFLNFKHNEIEKDNLGYLIPNHIIKKKIYNELTKFPNIKLFSKSECLSIEPNTNYSTITLSNGKKIKSSHRINNVLSNISAIKAPNFS